MVVGQLMDSPDGRSFALAALLVLAQACVLAHGEGVYECEVMRGIVYEDGEALSPVNATVRGSPLPDASSGVILSVRTTAYGRKLGVHADAPGMPENAMHTSISVYKDDACDASSRVATNKTDGAPLLARVPLSLSKRQRLSGTCKRLYVRAALDYAGEGGSAGGEVQLVSHAADDSPCVPVDVCPCVPPKEAGASSADEDGASQEPGTEAHGGDKNEREQTGVDSGGEHVVAQSIDDSFYIRMATYNLEDYARISANVAPLPNCTIPDGVGVFHVKRVSIWVIIAVAVAVAAVIMVAFMIANGISRSRHKPVELY